MSKIVTGVFAAVGTPRQQNGRFDAYSFQKNLAFLTEQGIRGFALNGATGEYCLTTTNELTDLLTIANQELTGSVSFVVGIGSAGLPGCVDNGKRAIDSGAAGVLLPMPHFFPYAQDDLMAFCTEVARQLPVPILLYNLPQFTSGLLPATTHELIRNCPNIVGIKDSSGSLETLRDLTNRNPEACRIIGNDSAFADALRESVCDGVISGVAGVLPELILALYGLKEQTNSTDFQAKESELNEFIEMINALPTPWGLKVIAECRGLTTARFSQPLSNRRVAQIEEIKSWFQDWFVHFCR